MKRNRFLAELNQFTLKQKTPPPKQQKFNDSEGGGSRSADEIKAEHDIRSAAGVEADDGIETSEANDTEKEI